MAADATTPALEWRLLVKKRESATQGIPPGKEAFSWVTNAVTLVTGTKDALLVDTFLSEQHNRELADWIKSSGKRLAMIYVTHGHPDHFFGLKILQDQFPEARMLAKPNVVAAMHRTIQPEMMETNWRRRWPGQIAEELTVADKLNNESFALEGHECRIVDTGHTDTDDTTALYIPSIGLLVSGDAVYNETHPYLGESDNNGRKQWLSALNKIEALKPKFVVAGHGPLEPDCNPSHIERTRRYIEWFDGLCQTTHSSNELYDRMLQLYPNRLNPGSLWAGAIKEKGALQPFHNKSSSHR